MTVDLNAIIGELTERNVRLANELAAARTELVAVRERTVPREHFDAANRALVAKTDEWHQSQQANHDMAMALAISDQRAEAAEAALAEVAKIVARAEPRHPTP